MSLPFHYNICHAPKCSNLILNKSLNKYFIKQNYLELIKPTLNGENSRNKIPEIILRMHPRHNNNHLNNKNKESNS